MLQQLNHENLLKLVDFLPPTTPDFNDFCPLGRNRSSRLFRKAGQATYQADLVDSGQCREQHNLSESTVITAKAGTIFSSLDPSKSAKMCFLKEIGTPLPKSMGPIQLLGHQDPLFRVFINSPLEVKGVHKPPLGGPGALNFIQECLRSSSLPGHTNAATWELHAGFQEKVPSSRWVVSRRREPTPPDLRVFEQIVAAWRV